MAGNTPLNTPLPFFRVRLGSTICNPHLEVECLEARGVVPRLRIYNASEVGKPRITATPQLHFAHQFSVALASSAPILSTQSNYRMRFRTALFLITTGVPAIVTAAQQTLLSFEKPAVGAGSQVVNAIVMGGRSLLRDLKGGSLKRVWLTLLLHHPDDPSTVP